MISSGRPDASAKALRLRLDWLNAYKNDNLGLTPYVSLTWFHSHIDGYTETGGGFPVQWNSRNEHTSQGRLGMDGHSSNASGTILGLSNFELTGMNYRQNWLRVGAGVEALAGPGTASLMVNGTTENNGPSYWAYESYRLTF